MIKVKKFKSPHYIAEKLIELYEKIEKPILVDYDVIVRISGRNHILTPVVRKIFKRATDILNEKGYIIFQIPDEKILAVVKKDFVLNRWQYLDEEDIDEVLNYVEEEEIEITVEE
ncbi:hypothetical protein [Persephonella sp.]